VTTILLDVDGVCGDFIDALLHAVGSRLSSKDIDRWNIFEQLSKAEAQAAYAILCTSKFWLNAIRPVKIAQDTIARWTDEGCEIVFVTAPWTSCSTWDHARRAWLRQHFPPAEVVTAHAKQHVIGDVFIDDRESNVKLWSEAHPRGLALLLAQPHNRHARLRRYSWPEVVEVVAASITQRRT